MEHLKSIKKILWGIPEYVELIALKEEKEALIVPLKEERLPLCNELAELKRLGKNTRRQDILQLKIKELSAKIKGYGDEIQAYNRRMGQIKDESIEKKDQLAAREQRIREIITQVENLMLIPRICQLFDDWVKSGVIFQEEEWVLIADFRKINRQVAGVEPEALDRMLADLTLRAGETIVEQYQ